MIIDEPIWTELKPYVWKEEATTQPCKDGPRYRRKISRAIPYSLFERAKKVKTKCVVCGRFMHPVRESKGQPYVNVACNFGNHERGWGCARKISKVRPYILKLEAAISETKEIDPRQQDLF